MGRLLFLCSAALLFSSISLRVEAGSASIGDTSSKELEVARKLQGDIDKLGEELTTKMLALEVEFHKKKVPILAERNQLLKSISGFWTTIITRHPNHHSWIRGNDEDILKSLIDVEISDLSDNDSSNYPLHSYRISMKFSPNEFFTDTVLYRDIKGGFDDEGVSGVNWIEGKAPHEASFFNFFESNIPDSRGRSPEHIRHEIAHVFRYEFWQNPFTYYDQPSYHDYQHLSEEQYAQYHEDNFGTEQSVPTQIADSERDL